LALLLSGVVCALLSGCAAPPRLGEDGRKAIRNRTFVVTGASSGFGRGVALRLASYGGNVVLASRRPDVLDRLAVQLRAAGGTPLVVTTDVSKPEEVDRLAQEAAARFGRIDVWINDAGVAAIGRFDQIPLKDQARVIDVNLKGVLYGSYAALRQFRKQGYGTLVNIASVEGKVPLAYQAAYSASKHGVVGLDGALNEELRLDKQHSIHVVTVEPWAADTPLWEHAANYSGHRPQMAVMDGPWEVVDAIVWACVHPVGEMPVGWKAQAAVISHQIMPDMTEAVAACVERKSQIESAPPAPSTSGNLFEPMASGTTVEGGARRRMGADGQ
jgi:short-subunit dehydrogenase